MFSSVNKNVRSHICLATRFLQRQSAARLVSYACEKDANLKLALDGKMWQNNKISILQHAVIRFERSMCGNKWCCAVAECNHRSIRRSVRWCVVVTEYLLKSFAWYYHAMHVLYVLSRLCMRRMTAIRHRIVGEIVCATSTCQNRQKCAPQSSPMSPIKHYVPVRHLSLGYNDFQSHYTSKFHVIAMHAMLVRCSDLFFI